MLDDVEQGDPAADGGAQASRVTGRSGDGPQRSMSTQRSTTLRSGRPAANAA